MVDPEFWSVVTSLRQVRDCGSSDIVESLLAGLAWMQIDGPPNGITTTLLSRINALGWQVDQTGHVRDRFGSFSLFGVSSDELFLRATWSWQQVVSAQVAGRGGFASLHLADVPCTRAWLDILPLTDRALFRKVLNGAIFTADFQSKWDANTNAECPFCECTDGRFHRWWICEALEGARFALTDDIRAMLPSLPECLTSYGWALRPHTWSSWIQLLSDIPSPEVPTSGPGASVVNVFTDGSCWLPHDHALRFASWAFVTACPDSLVLQPVVAAGPLPGIIQTAYRAELFAIYQVLRWARLHNSGVRLWVDCLSVVKVLQTMLSRAVRPKANCRHGDLWGAIFDLLLQLRGRRVSIAKVSAHVKPETCQGFQDKWCATHNGHVDAAAARANQGRAPAFWQFFARHSEVTHATRDVCRRIQAVQLAVSKLVVQREAKDDEVDPPPPGDKVRPQPSDPTWVALPVSPAVDPVIDRRYGPRITSDIRRWFWQLVSASERACWVSHYQLYIDFMSFWGCGGPINIDHKWVDSRDCEESELIPFHFKKRCSWWTYAFRATAKAAGCTLTTEYCRPNSHMLCVHTGCVWVPWPSHRLEIIDQWVSQFLPHPATRNGDSLVRLPSCRGPSRLAQNVH